jgi:hypothetical protein
VKRVSAGKRGTQKRKEGGKTEMGTKMRRGKFRFVDARQETHTYLDL